MSAIGTETIRYVPSIADGIPIAFRVLENSGPALILGHGVCADMSQMERTLAPGLHAEGFRVILYDQRGAGRSSKPSEPESYTLNNYVNDVLAVCKEVSSPQENLAFAGYSLAGRIALACAKESPETFNKFVILSYGSELTAEVMGFIKALQNATGDQESLLHHLKNIGSGRLLEGLNPEGIENSRKAFAAYTKGALEWPLVMRQDLEQMTNTLRIVGRNDTMMVRSAILDDAVSPKSNIFFLSGDHPSPLQQKGETVPLIARFLR